MGARNLPPRNRSAEASLISVGKITKPIGVRGEVKVFPFTRETRDLKRYSYFFLLNTRGQAQKIQPESLEIRSKFAVLKFSGRNRVEDVQDLIGQELYIQEEQLKSLTDDEYFIRDLVGIKVYSTQNECLGVLTDVLELTAQHIYQIIGDDGEILVPAVKEYIVEVNIARRRMVIRMEEEFRHRSGGH
jgi:16S rRNA processing protein RimM